MEPADVEPDVEPPAEPAVEPPFTWPLVVGVVVGPVVAAGLATVTVGAPAVAVSVLPPFVTDTVALNLIVSPPGAVFGTVTSASTCGVPGSLAGSVSVQMVWVGLGVQLSTVKTGLPNAGLFAPGVSVVAIAASSAELDQAEILNRTVLPGCTVLADAVTASEGFVGVSAGGGSVGVALADGSGDVIGVPAELGVGSAGGEEAFGAARVGEAAEDEDFGAAGVGEAAEGEDFGAAEVDDAAEVLNATGVADGAAVADALVLDGVGVAVGVAPRAVPVAPLKITKRPVARPSVTGRACADRMRTPCLCEL